MKIEILLIINSLLVAICLYFIRDFHKDFKQVASTVQGLKEKFAELSIKFNFHINAIKDRLNHIDKQEEQQ